MYTHDLGEIKKLKGSELIMKRHTVLIIGFFIIFAVLSGCSSGGGIPVTPSIPEGTTPLISEPGDRGTEEEMTTPFGGMFSAGGDPQAKVSLNTSEGHYILFLYDDRGSRPGAYRPEAS